MAKFCGQCGSRLDEKTGLCPACSKKKHPKKTPEAMRKRVIITILILVILIISAAFLINTYVFKLMKIHVLLGDTDIANLESNVEICKEVNQRVGIIVEDYMDDDGYVDFKDAGRAGKAVYKYAKILEKQGEIDECAFCEESGAVSLFLKNGSVFVYLPSIRDTFSGGNYGVMALTQVKLWQSAISSGLGAVGSPYLSAKYVYDNCKEYTLLDNITKDYLTMKEYATIDNIKGKLQTLRENNIRVIFWGAHGGVAKIKDKDGNLIKTAVFQVNDKVTDERQYESGGEEIIIRGDGSSDGPYYLLTNFFFENNMDQVDGGLFFCTACYSLADGGTMAKVFLDKGFDCYVGTSNAMLMTYGNGVAQRVAEYLTDHAYDNNPATIGDALDYATEKMGKTDINGTKFLKYSYKNSDEMEFTLIPQSKHFVSGVVYEKTSEKEVAGAEVTVFDSNGTRIASVKTDTDGFFYLNAGNNSMCNLKVTADGYIDRSIENISLGEDRITTEVLVDITKKSSPAAIQEPLPECFYSLTVGGRASWEIRMERDGSFKSELEIWDYGNNGPGYANGTCEIEKLTGVFSEIEKISENSYRMVVSNVGTELQAGETYYSDEAKYVVSGDSLISNGDEYYLFLPGTARGDLPQDLVDSVNANGFHAMDEIASDSYILYHPKGCVFASKLQNAGGQADANPVNDRQLTTLTAYGEDHQLWYQLEFDWDENGRLIQVQEVEDPSYIKTWTFQYNEQGKLLREELSAGGYSYVCQENTYSSDGKLLTGRESTDDGDLETTYQYDSAGRLCGIIQTDDFTRRETTCTAFNSWGDPVSREITETVLSTGATDYATERYEYDELGQLTAWSYSGTNGSYRYDVKPFVVCTDARGGCTLYLRNPDGGNCWTVNVGCVYTPLENGVIDFQKMEKDVGALVVDSDGYLMRIPFGNGSSYEFTYND